MPRLAVLMPVRNGLPFLARAISSTLAAMPVDSRLYILDDGSEPATQAFLARQSCHRRVVLVRREQPRGVAHALQDLMSSSDSEWVARMDGDDVTLPWRFSLMARAMKGHDAAFGAIIRTTGRGMPIRPDRPGRFTAEAIPLHLLLGNALVHPTLLSRRSAIERVGGYRASAAEDYDLWLRMAAAGMRMTRIATPVLLYRTHPQQVTAAAPWAERRDPPLLESYRELANGLLDDRAACVGERVALGIGRQPKIDEVSHFVRVVSQASSHLRGGQRVLLRSRLRAVVRSLAEKGSE